MEDVGTSGEEDAICAVPRHHVSESAVQEGKFRRPKKYQTTRRSRIIDIGALRSRKSLQSLAQRDVLRLGELELDSEILQRMLRSQKKKKMHRQLEQKGIEQEGCPRRVLQKRGGEGRVDGARSRN